MEVGPFSFSNELSPILNPSNSTNWNESVTTIEVLLLQNSRINELQDKNDLLQDQNSQLEDRVDQLQVRNDHLQDQNNQLATRVDQLQYRNNHLEDRVAYLEAQIAAIISRLP